MEISSESLKEQIPYYLTKEQKEGFLTALRDFQDSPVNTNYYFNGYPNELLQGDGWTHLQARRFETGEKESILGIVLSNTCDVTPEHQRDFPVRIAFAPLIPVAAYVGLLQNAGVDPNEIQDKVASIKEQKVTSIFFLPAGNGLQRDHIALFDELYTMPAEAFEVEKARAKVFTLSMIGFYLFVFKLSYHFCRFSEDVARN